jgi:hypothetical protein
LRRATPAPDFQSFTNLHRITAHRANEIGVGGDLAGEHALMQVGSILAQAAEGVGGGIPDRADVNIVSIIVNTLTILVGSDRPLFRLIFRIQRPHLRCRDHLRLAIGFLDQLRRKLGDLMVSLFQLHPQRERQTQL